MPRRRRVDVAGQSRTEHEPARRRAAKDPERASDEGTYVNLEPADLEDSGYQALEADAAVEAEIQDEAAEFADVDANPPLDEDIEDAGPTHLRISTRTGDTIEEDIQIPPENERGPAANADQPLQRAPDERQPETAGHDIGDYDIEGNWPEEGYHDPD